MRFGFPARLIPVSDLANLLARHDTWTYPTHGQLVLLAFGCYYELKGASSTFPETSFLFGLNLLDMLI